MNALLVCNAGVSAGPLAQRMAHELAAHGVAGDVLPGALVQVLSAFDGWATVVLLAPQIAYALRDVQKVVGGAAVACVPMADYTRLNAKKIVDDALLLVGE